MEDCLKETESSLSVSMLLALKAIATQESRNLAILGFFALSTILKVKLSEFFELFLVIKAPIHEYFGH